MTYTENVSWHNLTYTEVCRTDAMVAATEVLESLGLGVENPWSPVALFLRPAEAVDAVRAFAASGARAANGTESAGMLICGVTMTGGILYSLFFIPVFFVALGCLPLFWSCSFFCLRLFACLCCCFAVRPRETRPGRDGKVAQFAAVAPNSRGPMHRSVVARARARAAPTYERVAQQTAF